MRVFKDFEGQTIRLTAERLKHIREHPEMRGLIRQIKETLTHPFKVVRSLKRAIGDSHLSGDSHAP